jgi:hypothetical protein
VDWRWWSTTATPMWSIAGSEVGWIGGGGALQQHRCGCRQTQDVHDMVQARLQSMVDAAYAELGDCRTCAPDELAERHRRGAERPSLPPARHARRTSSRNGTATNSSACQEFRRFIAEVDEAEGRARAHAMTDLNT